MLEIYNSLTRRKEPFVPLAPGAVRMYVCGMTVYDYCHVGHARVMVVFDVVARYLRARGYRLTYVRNITDIDDKIIARARERGESIAELTARYIDAMHEDSAALGVLTPDIEPRATEAIPAMIEMIQSLQQRGLAYAAANGDVYYDVSGFADYGRLSGERADALRAGARVEPEEVKDDPLDFVLWKAAKPGEPAWDSPWGSGRPGWHIECSAMSTQALGSPFDLHGGGMDLKFPHHENEIAQSEGALGVPFVRLWMHNGFVRVNEEKMSKSLGNFFTVREVLTRYRPEELRLFILASHYRGPLNYGEDNLDQARAGLARLYTALRGLTPAGPVLDQPAARFHAAMEDDFNTPEALAVLYGLANECNRLRVPDPVGAARCAATLRELGGLLGLLGQQAENYFREPAGGDVLSAADIEARIAERNAARAARNFAASDRIRDELKAQGVLLEDGASGTVWRRI